MLWSDVTRAPQAKTLRQFAAMWLIVFGALAAWRVWHIEHLAQMVKSEKASYIPHWCDGSMRAR